MKTRSLLPSWHITTTIVAMAILLFVILCVMVLRSQKCHDKQFVFVVPSYNNEKWCEKNISSILSQDYSHFRVIFIDDNSQDTTFTLVTNYIAKTNNAHRCSCIRNTTRKGALANLYTAIHSCKDDEIILMVDGDDWMYHNQVVKKLNEVYQDEKVWITYGQFVTYPENYWGICRELTPTTIAENSYRKSPWVTSHLRTFYAGLFKKIKKEDLIFDGVFFDVTWDQAILFPMLEMASGRVAFIPDALYVYNQANPLNDYKNKYRRIVQCEQYIRNKTPYAPIESYA